MIALKYQAAIITAIKAGNLSVPEISKAAQLSPRQVRIHANTLVKAGTLQKEFMVTGEGSRKSLTCHYSLGG